MSANSSSLFSKIENTIQTFNFESIPAERKIILQPLLDYIQAKVTNHQAVRLNLICTHNSRRSHLAQVWAQTAAAHFDIEKVYS